MNPGYCPSGFNLHRTCLQQAHRQPEAATGRADPNGSPPPWDQPLTFLHCSQYRFVPFRDPLLRPCRPWELKAAALCQPAQLHNGPSAPPSTAASSTPPTHSTKSPAHCPANLPAAPQWTLLLQPLLPDACQNCCIGGETAKASTKSLLSSPVLAEGWTSAK